MDDQRIGVAFREVQRVGPLQNGAYLVDTGNSFRVDETATWCRD